MACMCVPPSWLVATPWLVPILLRPLVKVRGSSPRRGSSPLLIVPTPKGWKAEYTLASRMQIHESLRVLALLTRGEARTSDPWICSLMLYHLSYLTTDSANKIRSPANSMAQICISQIVIPNASFSEKVFGSLRKRANSRGDNRQPGLSPFSSISALSSN